MFSGVFFLMCSLESFEKRLEDTGETPVILGKDAVKVMPPFDEGVLKTIKVTIHQHLHTKQTLRKEEVGTTNAKFNEYHSFTT